MKWNSNQQRQLFCPVTVSPSQRWIRRKGMRNTRIFIAFMAASLCAPAQWVNHPTPGTPRTKDGKPNLAAPAPRTSHGKPNLSGVWQAEDTPIPELVQLIPGGVNGLGESVPNKYFINILADFKAEEAPLRASGPPLPYTMLAVRKDDPRIRCLPSGMPMVDTLAFPFKIVQTPSLTMMLFEEDTTFRQIFTDGRKLPEDPQPSWMGYSVGKWEGDALVVESIGLTDRSWLDVVGHRHSEALHVTERFHRVNFGLMELQLTLDDPKTFTRPVTVNLNVRLRPDTDLIEYYCSENEKDVDHVGLK